MSKSSPADRRSSVSRDGGDSLAPLLPFSQTRKKLSTGQSRGKSILQPPKQPTIVVPVIFEGVDVTPPFLNPYIYEGAKERQLSVLDSTRETSFFQSSLSRVDSQKFQANLLQQKQELENLTVNRKSILASFGDDILITAVIDDSSKLDSALTEDEDEPQESNIRERAKQIPQQISLILQETETMFLFEMPSSTVPRGSELADAIEDDNRLYEHLTKGKGRYRKMLTVAVQTLPLLMKGRDTETTKMRFQNNSTYVSAWEMYDTFMEHEEHSDDEEEELYDEYVDLDDLDDHRLNDEQSLDSYRLSIEDKAMNKLVKSKNFYDALIVIERILGNNCYNEEQKRFKGLKELDFLREDIEYKYELDLMWTYANDETDSRCVTAITLNSFNEDIAAVAYGKYFYNDRNSLGLVMIWNIKNPQQPERQYKFGIPVTALDFAKTNPNLLAVGFYNGDLKILDVSKRDTFIIREDLYTSFEPLWGVVWFLQGDEEAIMTSYGNGYVYKFQITNSDQLKCTQIMLTATAEGRLKGIHYLKKCEDKDVSITRFAEGRCLTFHPMDPCTYFVGTSEGVIHRCSTNYYNEHMDLVKAHEGAVHTMKFSPFANKLYFTCGDDYRARLWIDGIQEPLVTSEPSIVPLLDVDWSPAHSTVIAAVRGTEILIYDMQRKMYAPQSVTKSPTKCVNTICKFSSNGKCLMIGDMAGNVHVFALENMPIPAFFPEDLMAQSLKRLLVTRPDLIKKVKKLGSLNFDEKQFSKYFN